MKLNIKLSRMIFVFIGFCIIMLATGAIATTLDYSLVGSNKHAQTVDRVIDSFSNAPLEAAQAWRSMDHPTAFKIMSDIDQKATRQSSSDLADFTRFDKTLPIDALVLSAIQASNMARSKRKIIKVPETQTYSMLLVGIAMIGFGVRRQLRQ